MTAFSVRYEDKLEGPSNFVPWKGRSLRFLEEHDLWHFVETEVAPPIVSTVLEEYNKNTTNAKQVIVNLAKVHLIPPIAGKKIGKEMFDALVTLYWSGNINQRMLLRIKFKATWISKTKSVANCMKIVKHFLAKEKESAFNDLYFSTF